MLYDVIIIGGGVSGLCAAIGIKKRNKNTSVLILEKLSRVGRKLSVTGNGRCNISNLNIELHRYHGENNEFARFALEKYTNNSICDFFSELGVPIINEGDKLFPASLQAASVVDALRFECERLNIEVLTETEVSSIKYENKNYTVLSRDDSFKCRNLIAASGLLSGGEKLGASSSVLNIFKNMGIKTVKVTPSLVQLKTETQIVKQLKGIKIDAAVTLKADGKNIRTETGETLFCDYGLSGPPILQISRESSRVNAKKISVCIDVLPATSFSELYNILTERKRLLYWRTADEFFTGMLNKRLGQVLLKEAGFKLNESVKDFDDKRLKKLCSIIKCFEFTVTGNGGFPNSQVSAGGLDTDEFDSATMMSKKYPRLFAIGEILDIDGDCGGFNIQWAFSSALCAADCIAGEKL